MSLIVVVFYELNEDIRYMGRLQFVYFIKAVRGMSVTGELDILN